MNFRRVLFRGLQRLRYRFYLSLLDPAAKTLLDLGCADGGFVRLAQGRGLSAKGTDIENDIVGVSETADIVTCFEVLEHVPDPVAALRNIAKLYRRQLIISVPNEPCFSILRLGWEPEHLWAITPAVLKHHLGPPTFEKKIVLHRYYVGVWEK